MFKPQLINVDSSLPTCTKTGLSLQHHRLCFQLLHLFLSFLNMILIWQCLKLLPPSILLATLLCLASYKQCSTRLLKVLHKGCDTDVLGILLIYPYLPLGAARHHDCAYILVTPLTAVFRPINIYIYTYVVCVYVCM